jgi:nitroreductase
MKGFLEPLLDAATRAPSGDNMQPWRFVVDGETVSLDLDPGRDPSPMNAGQRMSRIAVGAALENLIRAAGKLGLAAELVDAPAPHLARVRLSGEGNGTGRLDADFGGRVTNRRPYDGRPLAPEGLARLTVETAPRDGVLTHWVVGADRLKALADTIGRADGVMFGDPSMRRAFLGNVRFDRPAEEPVDEGLSLGSLELSAADRLALRIMRRTPDLVLKLAGASAVFRGKARQLIVSASGLFVVAAPDDAPATDVAVGRAMQRAWLALTAEGLSAQPMMSLPVLENALAHGDDALRAALGVARVSALLDEFRTLVPELGGHRPAWVMRFGHAPPPSGRTGRLAVDRVTSYDEIAPVAHDLT